MVADVTVLVVGAGPTGLLLAAELHRRSVKCRLIDAHPARLDWDRATVVKPRTLQVFESLGIIEPLLAAGLCAPCGITPRTECGRAFPVQLDSMLRKHPKGYYPLPQEEGKRLRRLPLSLR